MKRAVFAAVRPADGGAQRSALVPVPGVFAVGDVRSGSVKRVGGRDRRRRRSGGGDPQFPRPFSRSSPLTRRAIPMTTKTCAHLNTIREVTPSALGCEECLKTGDAWVHLRSPPHVRPCRMLRPVPEPARDQAFSLDPPSDH